LSISKRLKHLARSRRLPEIETGSPVEPSLVTFGPHMQVLTQNGFFASRNVFLSFCPVPSLTLTDEFV
jgi:hypothetical protein